MLEKCKLLVVAKEKLFCRITPRSQKYQIFKQMFLHRRDSANMCIRKGNNRNTRKRFEICFKLTIKTPERRQ